MDDTHREIVLRVRLNRSEHEALTQIAAVKGLGLAAALRQYIYLNANLPSSTVPPKGRNDSECLPAK